MAAPVPAPERHDGQPKLADSLALGNHGALPPDVLYEILLRVQAKDLCRLRLVSRSWLSLTSDPSFTRAHSSRHPMIAGLRTHSTGIRGKIQIGEIQIVDLSSGNIDTRVYDFGLQPVNLELSTQGGLICASAIGRESRACIIDPTTGVTNILPDDSMDAFSVCILGHVPSTGEYKVLRVGASIPPTKLSPCEVMTLICAQRWRARSNSPFPVSIYQHMPVVRGVVYFLLGCFSVHDFPNAKKDDIVAFDLATEEWGSATIQGPFSTRLVNDNGEVVYNPTLDYIKLAKLNNFLVTMHHSQQYHSTDFWFLVDMDKGQWTKRYTIPCLLHWDHHLFSPLYPLVILDDGRIVVVLRFVGRQVLKAYDPRMDTWTDLTMPENYVAVSLYEGGLLLHSDRQG